MDKPSIVAILNALSPGLDLPDGAAGWRAVKCPFHDDRAASASYNPTSERFRCHGCGMSGDGFDLIMEVERCDFATALNRAMVLCGQEFKAISPGGAPAQQQHSRLTSRKNSQRSKLIRSRKRR